MEWLVVKNILILWIVNHVEHNIDESLALWLDPNGTLYKKYKDHKIANPNDTRDVRAHYLLDLYQAYVGSNVSATNLISILEQHPQTAQAIEELSKLTGNDCESEEQKLIESTEEKRNDNISWVRLKEMPRRPRRRLSARLTRTETEQPLRNLPDHKFLSRKLSSSIEKISCEDQE